jgi:hypothetical protein
MPKPNHSDNTVPANKQPRSNTAHYSKQKTRIQEGNKLLLCRGRGDLNFRERDDMFGPESREAGQAVDVEVEG